MSETMRDRYEHDNVEFDLPVENICQELCEEIDRLRADSAKLREALEEKTTMLRRYEWLVEKMSQQAEALAKITSTRFGDIDDALAKGDSVPTPALAPEQPAPERGSRGHENVEQFYEQAAKCDEPMPSDMIDEGDK